jgi:3'-5' exoribonuclease 1
LSKFCIHLTGITQLQVDSAETFPNVLNEVNQWLISKELGTTYKYVIATDGPWDFENFLNLQCQQSVLQYPYWGRRWVDVRKMFANWFNVRRCGIEKMLHYLGLEFEGKQHCGLDDARNISRILMKLIIDGCELKLNERIRNCRSVMEKAAEFNKQDSLNIEMNDENN